LEAHSPNSGPATSFTALIPDLHHYRGSFGGRAFPLWLDSGGSRPNVVPGLLDALSARLGRLVNGPDLFAYVAAITSHAGYIERFREDLMTPGLRIPLTADGERFDRMTELGRRVLWLHTYGERFVDAAADRPPGAPRAPSASRPLVTVAIPDSEQCMPEEISHDAAAEELHIGTGRVIHVTTAMWEYETSGYKLIRRWFARRKRDPDGKRSSPLDHIVERSWDTDWTSELIDLLNVVSLLVDLEDDQDALLGEVVGGELISVADLTDAGVLPVDREHRQVAEKPPKQEQF
jgi:Type ISP C-terminal specificity domain